MPETPNHSYNVPNEGAQDWHVPLNENFRQYDVDIELRGPRSTVGDNDPLDGAKFLATDTGLVLLGDGSEWTPTLALARYLAPEIVGNAGGIVLGSPANVADADGAVVAGGGVADSFSTSAAPNEVTAAFGTVGGGNGNSVSAIGGVVGGGEGNTVGDTQATVGGGVENGATGNQATVAGGDGNTASGNKAAVGAGRDNVASGDTATVGGGGDNVASGNQTTIGGGVGNVASTTGAAIGGGDGNTAGGVQSTVGGGRDNGAIGGRSTVSGGENNDAAADTVFVGGGKGNVGAGTASTIAGGLENETDGLRATVGGGRDNTAGDDHATVAGGVENDALGAGSAVCGGRNNETRGTHATVGGGNGNAANGLFAAVAGGQDNTAAGEVSLAAGRSATAAARGSFVWGDASDVEVTADQQNQFKVQAGGGAVVYSNSTLNAGVRLSSGSGSWSSLSSRTAKSNVTPVDPPAVLESVRDLEVSTWEYDTEDDAVHMGPMAEDFSEAFGLGTDDRRIATVDADGVALAAIQGLSQELEDTREELAAREERIEDQRERIEDLEAENEALRERLAAVEDHLDLSLDRDREDTGPTSDTGQR